MFRIFGLLLLLVFVLTLIRSLRVIFKGLFENASSPSSGSASAGVKAGRRGHNPPPMPAGGDLKRDPVCGTYVPANAALSSVSGGVTHYFCSETCRNSYLAPSGT